jgi:P27 family predicted phage terminase small subunit
MWSKVDAMITGRPRKPTRLHRLHGTRFRQDRAHEPVDPVGAPPLPAAVKLDPLARRHWRQITARLVTLRVLTRNHGEILGALCTTLANHERAVAAFAADGFRLVVVDEWPDAAGKIRRRTKPNPLLATIDKGVKLAERLLAHFGLSPATASKVAAIPDLTADPFELWARTLPAIAPRRATRSPRPRRGHALPSATESH